MGSEMCIRDRWIRDCSLRAWADVQDGKPNPLIALLVGDLEISDYLQPQTIVDLMQAEAHVGTAGERAKALAAQVREVV